MANKSNRSSKAFMAQKREKKVRTGKGKSEKEDVTRKKGKRVSGTARLLK
jgi:hypothetical protein